MRAGTLLISLCALTASGCATTLDPNYAIQIEAYRSTVAAQQAVEFERARAESARYEAIAAIGSSGDLSTRSMALVALALLGRGGGEVRNTNVVLPQAPESQESRAYKWAALFIAPAATVVQGYFGYRLGAKQSDNQANTTIASYNALLGVAGTGFGATQSIAGSGFNAVGGTLGGLGDLLNGLGRPNVSIGHDGVIGNGSFTGPNSGTNSGNSGHIGNQDRIDSPDNPLPVPTPTPTFGP